MIQIGEFSKLSGISVRMLRHYDSKGLMVPDYIDEETNYRYYSYESLLKARKITALRDIGCDLKEIKEILKDEKKDLDLVLSLKLEEKKKEVRMLEKQIKSLKLVSDSLSKFEELTHFKIKKLPGFSYLSQRKVIHKFSDEGIIWDLVNQKFRDNHFIKETPFFQEAIRHSSDLIKKNYDIEARLSVKDNGNSMVSFQEEMQVASLLFTGDYDKLGMLYKTIYELIDANGFAPNGADFLLYYLSPGNEINKQKFLTEICVPIKQK